MSTQTPSSDSPKGDVASGIVEVTGRAFTTSLPAQAASSKQSANTQQAQNTDLIRPWGSNSLGRTRSGWTGLGCPPDRSGGQRQVRRPGWNPSDILSLLARLSLWPSTNVTGGRQQRSTTNDRTRAFISLPPLRDDILDRVPKQEGGPKHGQHCRHEQRSQHLFTLLSCMVANGSTPSRTISRSCIARAQGLPSGVSAADRPGGPRLAFSLMCVAIHGSTPFFQAPGAPPAAMTGGRGRRFFAVWRTLSRCSGRSLTTAPNGSRKQ